jgi:CRISPR-associated endonuclease/helicase Cas3
MDDLEAAIGAYEPPQCSSLDDSVTIALMALASFSDWIASNDALFPYGRKVSEPREYLRESQWLAEQALDAIGWPTASPLAAGPVSFVDLFGFEPNDLQREVTAALAQVLAGGPVLLLIEAPMGAGKTEAALYAHLLLQQSLGHRGLYAALPTMATGNGLFQRVERFLTRLARTSIDLQLQHGAALLNHDYRRLRLRGMSERPDLEELEAVAAHEWFTPRKRAMLSPYGVGTVDQALLGVLRVRHHFVRLFGLANRTVVLDEVHAYDLYTSTLIETLLKWLASQGSSVIVMSATLPRERREALLRAYGAEGSPEEVPYPRVTLARAGSHPVARPVPTRRPWRVSLRRLPRGIKALAEKVKQLTVSEGVAACIVNTVERAQRLYEAMGPGQPLSEGETTIGKCLGDVEVYLLHSRYPSQERRAREEVVINRFGKASYREGSRPRKAVLIATQVVEQSLDLDFDVMLSDLAPVDLVLQRLGRLHRFPLGEGEFTGASRPSSHLSPVLYLAGLADDPPDLTSWDRVYHPYLLLRTWLVLRERTTIAVPADLEDLIEMVYSDALLSVSPTLAKELEKMRKLFAEELERQRGWAQGSAIQPGHLMSVSMDKLAVMRLEDEEEQETQLPLTRYGDPAVHVVPLHRLGERLYLDEAAQRPIDLNVRPDDHDAEVIFGRSVPLSGRGIYEALRNLVVPPGWQRHPLLRRLRPLELVDGEVVLDDLHLHLDPELGIVYRWR